MNVRSTLSIKSLALIILPPMTKEAFGKVISA
jgi:hypothetical protein